MPQRIDNPTIVAAAGTKPKEIREFVGRANTGHAELSIAQMKSPPGWVEPGQRPDFDEYTVVLTGKLRVEVEKGPPIEVLPGQAIWTKPGEWVRYSTPEGAEYIAVCIPAFAPDTVHRDPD